MSAYISKPGYWLITGINSAGQGVAGVVKYTTTGTLPNASKAAYVDAPNVTSLNMASLQKAIQDLHAEFLYEVPATGNHNNLQSIGARAVGQGSALYNTSQTGIQATNDLTLAALGIGGGLGLDSIIGGGAAAAGEEVAGGAAAGGAGATALESGAGSGAASLASKAATSQLGSLAGLASVGTLAALLTSTSFWIRAGEVVMGLVLLFLALKSFTGQTVDVTGLSKQFK